MKNLLLLAFTLFSFNIFAQTPVPNDPPEHELCYWFDVYACDENGELITDPNDPRYQTRRASIIVVPGINHNIRAAEIQAQYCEDLANNGFALVPFEC